MSTTTKDCRIALHTLIKAWFVAGNVPAEFSCPIAQENIIKYFTLPLETGDSPTEATVSPNWIIVYTIHSTTRGFTLGGEEQPATLGILLACTLSKSKTDAEASREAAEDWLDDAEEYMLSQLAKSKTDDWHRLKVAPPKRDANRAMYGMFRISNIVVNVEKK